MSVTPLSGLTLLVVMQVCHVKDKDIRKFLDGAYVEEKGQVVQPQD